MAPPLLSRVVWFSALVGFGSSMAAATETLLIGTYTDTTSKGIYALQLDRETGALSSPTLAAKISNPSFLAFSPEKTRLYAVDEQATTGEVNAFEVRRGGRLKYLNSQPSGGTSTTHIVVDPEGRLVMVANYGSSSVAVFPIGPDGGLQPSSCSYPLQGKLGPVQPRQKQSYPHSFTLSKDGRYAFVCDLGLDRLFLYRVDPDEGTISPAEPTTVATPPGSGPRHGAVSGDGKFVYIVNEVGGSVSVFSWNEAQRKLALKQTIGAIPKGYAGFNASAEIAIDPSGKFVYASDRGPDCIAIFARDPEAGTLAWAGSHPSGGSKPRNFALSPDGRWLVCANQESGNVVVFARDAKTGQLADTGRQAAIPHPVCVLFAD